MSRLIPKRQPRSKQRGNGIQNTESKSQRKIQNIMFFSISSEFRLLDSFKINAERSGEFGPEEIKIFTNH